MSVDWRETAANSCQCALVQVLFYSLEMMLFSVSPRRVGNRLAGRPHDYYTALHVLYNSRADTPRRFV